MGVYLNPGNKSFQESVEKTIYVDKSLLIDKIWKNAKQKNKYICISRPRRFGKSTDAGMLTAYFSRDCDSHRLFDGLKIADCAGYEDNLNQYNVIHLNMQNFLSNTESVREMLSYLSRCVTRDILYAYPGIDYLDTTRLPDVLNDVFAQTGETFIFVIDEWDCIFREYKENKKGQRAYLDFIRLLLKDRAYVELAYMTGILPVKKYGTHSALNMFDEISMIDCKDYSEFMGFTDAEVKSLCEKFNADYSKMKKWYDGYHMRDGISTYSPRSVTASINNHDFSNYWSQTETYEALKVYLDLNYDGLKDTVVGLLAGNSMPVKTRPFQNDMSSFSSKDDVLTLLIHLGYLGYRCETAEIYIPNSEVRDTFLDSVENSDWGSVTKLFDHSKALLEATWEMNEEKVAAFLENSHYETSILQYNDENALAYTVNLAYIAAGEFYTVIRELPAGKGYADIAFVPKTDKPAMLIELKYDKTAETAITQIKERKYPRGLENYLDNLLLVAVNYDRNTKKHECIIQKYSEWQKAAREAARTASLASPDDPEINPRGRPVNNGIYN